MEIIIQTPRLVIRVFRAEEEAAYLKLFDNKAVLKYLPKRSREDLIKVFRESLEFIPGSVTGRWGIFDKENDAFIGLCLLRPFDDGSGSIELGYVIGQPYWGKGIATEMVIALLAWARKTKPGTTFVAITDIDNIASQRVLLHAGMKQGPNYFRMDEEVAFFIMESK